MEDCVAGGESEEGGAAGGAAGEVRVLAFRGFDFGGGEFWLGF